MSQATAALADAVRSGAAGWTSPERTDNHHPGAYAPPVVYDQSVRRVIRDLQTRIQEIILKDVLLDQDEAVPPQYQALVEEYYRVLSRDLR